MDDGFWHNGFTLKISWIKRIQQNSDAGWKAISERLLGDLGGLALLS